VKKIVLVEFPWQANKIVKATNFLNHIIISTDPEASYILKKNNYNYFEADEFCDHENLWAKYKHITDNSLKITKILDKHLWDFDYRFRDLRWNFFDDFHFMFKISYDQLYFYVELISNLIERFNPSQIIVADTENIRLDGQVLIDSNISLFKFLLQNLKSDGKKIEIKYITKDTEKEDSKYINSGYKRIIKKKLKNFYFKINFYLNYFLTRPQYLSVGSYEINKFKQLYPRDSKKYICYNYENINYNNQKGKWKYFTDFCVALEKDKEFMMLIKYKKISFHNLFFKIILRLSKNFDNFIKEYYNAKNFIYKIGPKCLIFETMTPFYSPNVIFRKICKETKIPYVTWVHGGYNGYSLHGWDVTDLRFCQNHISYGVHLDQILKNEKSILNKLNLQKNHKIYPVGSPRFDFFLRKKKKNRKLKKNSKYTILYTIGCHEPRNQFYFGYNRKKNFSQLWEFHYQVIQLLKKYQYKYNIIIKDIPTSKGLWKNILYDINAKNISYISNEFSFTDLLKISDLNLFPLLSTTFFESLYFDADIFFIEDKDEMNLNVCKNEFYFFNSVNNYINELEIYLNEGNFYKKTKNYSKDYFLNLKNFQKRDEVLKIALDQITQKI